MKVKHFHDTDTLDIVFVQADVAETRDLDEDTLGALDAEGGVCAITVEHARDRADLAQFSCEHTAA